MKKIITILLSCLASLVVLALVLFQPRSERFFCERCHRTVTEKPIFITEQTVDVMVCADCYQDYINGTWKIGQS